MTNEQEQATEIQPAPAEPPDHHIYHWIWFKPDTFRFYRDALAFYRLILEKDLEEVREDADLGKLLGEDFVNTSPVGKERKLVDRVLGMFDEKIAAAGPDAFEYTTDMPHWCVRLVKSCSLLYFEHLQERRDTLASRGSVSTRAVLDALDQKLAWGEEKIHGGLFDSATPRPLLVEQVREASDEPTLGTGPAITGSIRPRPVILDTIEILDSELRKRCLDIFAQFREDGQLDRLDTVLSDATRIVEDRLRKVAGAPSGCGGSDLVTYALCGVSPRLVVSADQKKQEAFQLLFRGFFGFVRNEVHHELVTTLQPERVLQLVGMSDHLIYVVEGAAKNEAPEAGA